MRKYLPLIIIIVIAVLTRLFFLGDFPKGFSGDEAQQGYSAYSLLKTGHDEWGQLLPLNPRGFGDFKPPLYTYLAIPSIAIFGLNETAVRLPAAVFGIMLVAVTYFLSLKLFNDKRIAFYSALLLAISPWHIQLSRTAFEAGPGIFLFSLGLLFYLISEKRKNFLIFAAVSWGLSLYSYHSVRIFILLFIGGLIVFHWKKLLKKRNILAALIFIIFTLPILANLKSVSARASDVSLLSNKVAEDYFKQKTNSLLPPLVDRLIDNKVYFLSKTFLENYLSYYSGQFFFSGNRSDNSYLNFPGFPLLFPIEIIFWLFAIAALIRKNNRQIVALWFLLATIPASLAVGTMSAHRAVTFVPLVSIISGLGLSQLIDYVKQRRLIEYKNFVSFLALILIVSFAYFAYYYLIKLPAKPPESLRVKYKTIFTTVLQNQDNYNQIIFSKAFSQPQIFVAFYSQMDPVTFQQYSKDWLRYEKSNKLYVDQLESWNLGKFYFEDVNWKDKDGKRVNALIIAKSGDFPAGIYSLADVPDFNGKDLYRLVPVPNYAR